MKSPRSHSIWSWLIVLAVIGLAGWFVTDHIPAWKDRFVPRRLRTVDEGKIYASGQINRHLIRDVLTDKKIKVIIILLADNPDDPDVAAELAACKELGIQRFNYPLSGDGTGRIENYADAVAKMVECEKEGKPVLLHCSSGVQRSNGATFFYRVLVQHRDARQAVAEIEGNGFDPHHSPELLPYLNAHMAEMAKLLKDKSVIDSVPNPLPQIQQ